MAVLKATRKNETIYVKVGREVLHYMSLSPWSANDNRSRLLLLSAKMY